MEFDQNKNICLFRFYWSNFMQSRSSIRSLIWILDITMDM